LRFDVCSALDIVGGYSHSLGLSGRHL
jgi:hypothetical protein